MKLPFAVYTARDGYAWQSGTEAGTGKLERLRKAIGKMPEFDFGDSASSGMLNAGDDIVLYRFMRQEKADSHGRAALYLAMTFFPRDDARFINADSALSSPPFAQPLKEPPSSFDYQGPPAVPSEFVVPEINGNGSFDQAGSLASAGFAFTQPFPGVLHISRAEPGNGKGAVYLYQQASQFHPRKPAKTAAFEPLPAPPQYKRAGHAVAWRRAAIAAILVAIMEGAVIIWIMLQQDGVFPCHPIGAAINNFSPDIPERPQKPVEPARPAVFLELAPGISPQEVHHISDGRQVDLPAPPEN